MRVAHDGVPGELVVRRDKLITGVSKEEREQEWDEVERFVESGYYGDAGRILGSNAVRASVPCCVLAVAGAVAGVAAAPAAMITYINTRTKSKRSTTGVVAGVSATDASPLRAVEITKYHAAR